MALCPLMSYATQQAQCVDAQCALWSAQDGHCGMLSGNNRITEGFDRLIQVINDIKVRL